MRCRSCSSCPPRMSFAMCCLVLDSGLAHAHQTYLSTARIHKDDGNSTPQPIHNTSDLLYECPTSQNFNVVAWHHGPRCSGRMSVHAAERIFGCSAAQGSHDMIRHVLR